MAKRSFNLQVPADVRSLVALLHKLGHSCGPIVNAQIDEDQKINIWFQSVQGVDHLKRVTATLIQGDVEVRDGNPRRVYIDIKIQNFRNQWMRIQDHELVLAGLQTTYEYCGECWIGIEYAVSCGEANWSDMSENGCDETVKYYRLLPGDRDRAIAEAERRIRVFEQQYEKAA